MQYSLPNQLVFHTKTDLLQLFRIWFEWVDLVNPTSYFSDAYCKMANYLDVCCKDFSHWIVAAITGERLVVLAFPFKVIVAKISFI